MPGQTLNPYRSKQYEVGLKSDIGEMNLGAALFRLERPFAYLDTDNVYKEQGNRVNNGLELTAAGNVWQGLNIYSGVTFLDPKLKDTANAPTSNKQVVGVPKVQANLLAEYSLPSIPEWVYSANVHYNGQTRGERYQHLLRQQLYHMGFGNALHHESEQRPNHFPRGGKQRFDKHYWVSIFPSGTDGDNGSPSVYRRRPRSACIRHLRFLMDK